MATYVVSDLHGQMGVFLRGLEKIGLKEEDELIMIGDAIDRGPDGIKLLQYIREHENMDLILGNHEFMMLNSVEPSGKPMCKGGDTMVWLYYNGGSKTFEQYKELSVKDRLELLTWLSSRQLIRTLRIGEKDFCLTHSFYDPKGENKTYAELDHEIAFKIVWLSMFRHGETHCSDVYSGYDYTFITGHVPVQRIRREQHMQDPYRLQPYIQRNLYDIDGGCSAGRSSGLENGALFLRLDDLKCFGVGLEEGETAL